MCVLGGGALDVVFKIRNSQPGLPSFPTRVQMAHTSEHENAASEDFRISSSIPFLQQPVGWKG